MVEELLRQILSGFLLLHTPHASKQYHRWNFLGVIHPNHSWKEMSIELDNLGKKIYKFIE
jgi:hypothetical protein